MNAGVDTTSSGFMNQLASLANTILVFGEISILDKFKSMISQSDEHKIIHIDIGDDVWGNPGNVQLMQLVDDRLRANNL